MDEPETTLLTESVFEILMLVLTGTVTVAWLELLVVMGSMTFAGGETVATLTC